MKPDTKDDREPATEPEEAAEESPEKREKPPKGTVYLNEAHCKGCSYCVVFCPKEALMMGGRMNRKGYHLPELRYPEKCNGCDICGLFCPDFAIFGVRLGKKSKNDDENEE